MQSRRTFLKKMGQGVALSTLVASAPGYAAMSARSGRKDAKFLKIGIIGAENSHTIEYGKIFNLEKKYPDAEVCCVWGETEAFAKTAMKEGGIPQMVSNPLDMLGKINALIVDHRHPKYHLPAAEPFVKAGVPTFIDKPFCYRVEEGKAFFEMAQKVGTPVTSYSMISQCNATYDFKDQVSGMGEISHIISCGPADPDSVYGGIFFYGIHIVQPLITIFGEEVQKVRVTRSGKNSGAHLVFRDGRLASLVFKNLSYGWEIFVENKSGIEKLVSRVTEPDPGRNYTDMVNMFLTGKEPISHSNILTSVAVLQALEKSASSDSWENVPSIS